MWRWNALTECAAVPRFTNEKEIAMRRYHTSKLALTLVAGVAGGFVLQSTLAGASAIQPETEPISDAASEYQNKMMEAIQLGQPGEHHEFFNKSVGTWNAHVEFYGPDGSVMAGEGTMTSKWVLDGRYLQSHFDMPDFMGAPFNGIAYNGYDNFKESYTSVWMDSMSTAIIYQTSELVDGEFITTYGHGGMMKKVISKMNDNEAKDIFFEQQDDGSWKKSGVITYTRQ